MKHSNVNIISTEMREAYKTVGSDIVTRNAIFQPSGRFLTPVDSIEHFEFKDFGLLEADLQELQSLKDANIDNLPNNTSPFVIQIGFDDMEPIYQAIDQRSSQLIEAAEKLNIELLSIIILSPRDEDYTPVKTTEVEKVKEAAKTTEVTKTIEVAEIEEIKTEETVKMAQNGVKITKKNGDTKWAKSWVKRAIAKDQIENPNADYEVVEIENKFEIYRK